MSHSALTQRSRLALPATALGAVLMTGCTANDQCFIDTDCAKGQICVNGKCVTGNRGGGDEGGDSGAGGDPMVYGDHGPPGDPSAQVPPTITIITPTPYELVHDVFVIKVLVTGPNEIDQNRVAAVVADRYPTPLSPTGATNQFAAQFDASRLPHMAFPTLVVSAYDVLGNKGWAGIEFALDNEPPILAFDSPLIVYRHYGLMGHWECSAPMDPLGVHHVRHGEVIDPTYYYGNGYMPRVRIEDQGNDILNNIPVRFSGVDDSKTNLYLLDSVGIAAGHKLLLHDPHKAAGTACAILDPSMLPDPVTQHQDQAIVQQLVPAGLPDVCSQLTFPEPFGTPDFSPRGSVTPPLVDCGGANCCDYNGLEKRCKNEDGTECYLTPNPQCDPTEAIYAWIGRNGVLPECSPEVPPAVYVLNQFNVSDELTCGGGPFDALNHAADGWACLAAAATDKFGNTGFTPPIVVCISRSGSPTACPGATPDPTTLCTNNCTTRDFGTGTEYVYWPNDPYP